MPEGDVMKAMWGKFGKFFLLPLIILVMSMGEIFSQQPRGRVAQPSPLSVLQIIRGLYGDLTLQAGVVDVTAKLQQSIQNNQLSLPAQSKMTWFGDPAPGRAKSLLIIFRIGNNLYLKLIADMAGDIISPATAQSAMLLIGQQVPIAQQQAQAAASAGAVVAPRVQQQAQVATTVAPRGQQQAIIPQQAAQQATQSLGGVSVMVAQPGAVAQPAAPSQQEVQMRNVQQQRMMQFRNQ